MFHLAGMRTYAHSGLFKICYNNRMPTEDQHPSIDPDRLHRFRLPDVPDETIRREYETCRKKYFDEFQANTHPIKPTPEQEQLIKEAIQQIPRTLDAYGILNADFSQRPLPKMFFLDRKDFYKYALHKELNTREMVTVRAIYDSTIHAFFMYLPKGRKRNERNEEILHHNVHELLHALSFRRLQVYKSKPGLEYGRTVDPQRTGVRMVPWGYDTQTDDPHLKFTDLNEAITEDLAIEVTNNIINAHPDQFRHAILGQIHVLLRRSRLKTARTIFVQDKEKELEKDGVPYSELTDRIAQSGYSFNIDENMFKQNYPKERKRFHHIIDALCRRTGKTQQEIKALFYGAYFLGPLRDLAKTVDGAIGKGTLRLIADDYFGDALTERLKQGETNKKNT